MRFVNRQVNLLLLAAALGLSGCGNSGKSGILTDTRDGQTYRTVKISKQTWMAENLNYPTLSGSWCYLDGNSKCNQYGRLYDWNTAWTACPAGWHLPTVQEWDNLTRAVGGERVDLSREYVVWFVWGYAGKKLKTTSGWQGYERNVVVGTNDYGFSALPGGYTYDGRHFRYAGNRGYWWTATEDVSGYNAHVREMYGDDDGVFESFPNDKNDGLSVRCVMNNKSTAKASSRPPERVDDGKPGILTDTRDGKTYRTVAIGGKRWMAENLNYQTDSSLCYEDSNSYCAQYGRLYDMETAKKVCPSGWHLPSRQEWDSLCFAVGGEKKEFERSNTIWEERRDRGFWDGAGKKLKSTSGWIGWRDTDNGNGTDDYGFSALPGGSAYNRHDFHGAGNEGSWWMVPEYWRDVQRMYDLFDGVSEYRSFSGWHSVRCVQDAVSRSARELFP